MCRERRSTKHRRMKKNGEHIMANISRRNFMKVAAGAAGIAGLGLLNLSLIHISEPTRP